MRQTTSQMRGMFTALLLTTLLLLVVSLVADHIAQDFRDASAEAIWIFDSDLYVKHVETADLNGDEIPDVIAAEFDRDDYGALSKVFGINGVDGDTLWSYQLDDGARSMTVGDINNDNVVDVIIGCSCHLGDTPDGRVHAIDGTDGSRLWTYFIGATIQSVTIGDFNGDLYLDVAAGSFDDYVYAINGENGNLLWSTEFNALWINVVDAGDVNGDNIDDVAYAHEYLTGFNNFCGVLDGIDGSDIWADTVDYIVLNVLMIDIDNDDDLETIFGGIFSDAHGEIFVRNAATGELEWGYDLGTVEKTNGDIGLFLHDLDEDTDLDLVVTTYLGSKHVWAFDGTSDTPMWISEQLDAHPKDAAFGDIIGDKEMSIALACSDRVEVIEAVAGTKVWYYSVAGTMAGVATGDFDSDSITDVAACGGAEFTGSDPGKSVWTLRTVISPVLWEYDFGGYGNAIAIDNLNGDEYMDVVTVCSVDDKAWALDGETGDTLWTWTGTENLYDVTTGDFDNNGQVDVAVAGYDETVTALRGNDGSVMWQYTVPTAQIYRKCLQAADLNNDGSVDVVAGSDDSHVYAINGKDASHLWTVNVSGHVGEIELAQMNGEGPLDVVVAVANGGEKVVVLDGEDGELLWDYPAPEAVEHVEVLDVDNDGIPDVAAAITPFSPKQIIMINGLTHTSMWSLPMDVASNINGLAHGDLDGDDKDDLIVPGNSTDKEIHALRGYDGFELWSYPTGGEVNCLLAYDVNNDKLCEVIGGSDDQFVYVLKGANGDLLWSYATADDVMDVDVGDISGNELPNIACVTFGSNGLVYTFVSLATGPLYICGDADGNDIVEVSDAVYLINYVFVPGSPAPDPYESGDVDCTGIVEISDAVYIVNYVFTPGSPEPCDPDGDGEPDC